MACPKCGSWSVRADRALSGRMVCGRCGQPLGIGAQGKGRRVGISRPRKAGLWLGLAALVLVSALLATLAERAPSPVERRRMGTLGAGLTLPAGVRATGASMCPSADRTDPKPFTSRNIAGHCTAVGGKS
jgi:hypothetical protein